MNEITKARYVAFKTDRNYVHFTMEIMFDVINYSEDDPEIAIRNRNSRSNEVMFIWSYEKFVERLELMREWYADLMDDGIINREHPIDPWSDINDEEIKRRIEEQKSADAERLEKLKSKLEDILKEKDVLDQEIQDILKDIESRVGDSDKDFISQYIEIMILGRPPRDDEKEMLEKMKALGDDFYKLCEEYNYKQGVSRDKAISQEEIERLLDDLKEKLENAIEEDKVAKAKEKEMAEEKEAEKAAK